MGRNTQLSLEDDNGRQLAIYKVNYGSKLFFKDGDLIDKGKKIVEWDPYTLPVIAETSGIVNYMDLMEGSSRPKLLMTQLVFLQNLLQIGNRHQKI